MSQDQGGDSEAKTQVFLSYASEDSAVAEVFFQALSKLGDEQLDFGLSVVRDIHSFEQGRSLGGEVLKHLKASDALFIIYTEALKKSHSWTGFEVGAFTAFMSVDTENADAQISKRIVSLYFDELPPTERDMIGIKLNMRSFRTTGDKPKISLLDQTEQLRTFFRSMSDLTIKRKFPKGMSETQIATLKKNAHDFIDVEVMKLLDDTLINALAGIVTRSSTQQMLFKTRWKAGQITDHGSADDVMSGAELISEEGDIDVFKIFGISDNKYSISWEDFKKSLAQHHAQHAAFIVNAFENVTKSAFSTGPIDNEQFFLAPDQKMYRIIVTRHHTFYDGSKYMHMYFVPMLSRDRKERVDMLLALSGVATRYRALFLEEFANLHLKKFRAYVGDPDSFYRHLELFMREFWLIEDECHVYRLDDAGHYVDIYPEVDAKAVASLFETWKQKRKGLIEVASATLQALKTRSNVKGATQNWIDELATFNGYVGPLNQQTGLRALDTLIEWFGGPQPSKPAQAATSASP